MDALFLNYFGEDLLKSKMYVAMKKKKCNISETFRPILMKFVLLMHIDLLDTVRHTHTRTQPFYDPLGLSGTTSQVCQHGQGKTNLDLLEPEIVSAAVASAGHYRYGAKTFNLQKCKMVLKE